MKVQGCIYVVRHLCRTLHVKFCLAVLQKDLHGQRSRAEQGVSIRHPARQVTGGRPLDRSQTCLVVKRSALSARSAPLVPQFSHIRRLSESAYHKIMFRTINDQAEMR